MLHLQRRVVQIDRQFECAMLKIILLSCSDSLVLQQTCNKRRRDLLVKIVNYQYSRSKVLAKEMAAQWWARLNQAKSVKADVGLSAKSLYPLVVCSRTFAQVKPIRHGWLLRVIALPRPIARGWQVTSIIQTLHRRVVARPTDLCLRWLSSDIKK